jgi:addiction module RelE/StbE family toxin
LIKRSALLNSEKSDIDKCIFGLFTKKQFLSLNSLKIKIDEIMKGIQFLVDENNKKTAVQIDLNNYGELWEDFYDTILIEEAKDETIISFDDFIEELKEDELLNDSEAAFIYSNQSTEYSIEIKESAKKDITTLSNEMKLRVLKKIKQLENNREPNRSNKIRSFDSIWRVKLRKSYRIIYDICDETLVIKIIGVKHRKDAYN